MPVVSLTTFEFERSRQSLTAVFYNALALTYAFFGVHRALTSCLDASFLGAGSLIATMGWLATARDSTFLQHVQLVTAAVVSVAIPLLWSDNSFSYGWILLWPGLVTFACDPQKVRKYLTAYVLGISGVLLFHRWFGVAEIPPGTPTLVSLLCIQSLLVYLNSSQHIATQHALQQYANTDPLTQIRNRRGILASITEERARALRTGATFAILLCDLDHFKRINDKYGHISGDQALIHVTHALENGGRTIDIVGRIGGEEFLIVLPGTGASTLAAAAERYRKIVEDHPFDLHGVKVPLTISIGAVHFRPGMATEALIGVADAALYRAKAAGRNKVVINA